MKPIENPQWQQFHAGKAGSRFDRYLQELFPKLKRSSIQELIKKGQALLNKKKVKPGTAVKKDMLISILLKDYKEKKELKKENIKLNIIHEDEEIIVINKSADLVVHPAQGNWTGTLINALLHHCGEKLLKIHAGEEIRPGIVHRIDKNTSGVLVVAKSKQAQEELSQQFQKQHIERSYRGICWGVIPESGIWNDTIGRDAKKRQRMCVKKDGRKAITHYKRLKNFGFASYFCASLETGRTHQIRVHFSHHDYPLIGDSLYGEASSSIKRIKNAALRELHSSKPSAAKEVLSLYERHRQALHAYQLTIVHPKTKQKTSYTAELPEDIQKILELFSSLG